MQNNQTTNRTETQATETKREKKAMNGVKVPQLLATINAVAGQPELAAFTFRCANEWISGTHSRTTMERFEGAGGSHDHVKAYTSDADHPQVLCGEGNAATPPELLLSVLAQCLTSGIANIASARGIELRSVKSTVEGKMDLQGMLGIDKTVRNGFSSIRVHFDVDGDASPEDLQKVVEQSRARSAVFDCLTNGVDIDVAVNNRV